MRDVHSISRREVLAAAGIAVMAPYLAACGSDDKTDTGGGGSGTGASKQLTKVTFRLDWQLEARQAPFVVAKQQNYFADEGLDVDILPGTTSADNIKFLSQNRIQFALIDGISAVQGSAVGVAMKSLGVYFQKIPSCITSLEDSPIKSLEEMVGKTIGTSRGSASDVATRALLQEKGIDINSIKFVDTGFSAIPLAVGKVDGLVDFAMAGPPTIENAGKKPYVLLLADQGLPGYGASLFASDKYLADNSKVADGFVRAIQKGVKFVVDDPQAGLDALYSEMQNPDKDLEKLKMDAALPFYSSDLTKSDGYLAQTDAGWGDTISSAKTVGVLDDQKAPTSADMIDPNSPATAG